jgi:hypothetical protein
MLGRPPQLSLRRRVFPTRFEDLARLAFFYKKYVSICFFWSARRVGWALSAVGQALADVGSRPRVLDTDHLMRPRRLLPRGRSVSMSEHEGLPCPGGDVVRGPDTGLRRGCYARYLGGRDSIRKNYESWPRWPIPLDRGRPDRQVVASGRRPSARARAGGDRFQERFARESRSSFSASARIWGHEPSPASCRAAFPPPRHHVLTGRGLHHLENSSRGRGQARGSGLDSRRRARPRVQPFLRGDLGASPPEQGSSGSVARPVVPGC